MIEQHKTQHALEIEENRDRRSKAVGSELMFYRACTPCKHGKFGRHTLTNRFYCAECRPRIIPIPDEPNYTTPFNATGKRSESQRYSLIDTEKRVVKFYDGLCKRSASVQPHYSSSGACACVACLEVARQREKRNRDKRRDEKGVIKARKEKASIVELSRQNVNEIARKNKLINSVWGAR